MIYIVRHGETDSNTKGLMRGGFFDDQLNAVGMQQAKTIANVLRGIDFDVVYASKLKRTAQTCNQIWQGQVTYDDRLLPRNYGEFANKPLQELLDGGYLCRGRNLPIKNGESIRDLENRVRGFVEEIREKHKSQTVLVVTHASICNIVKGILDNFSSKDYLTKNCEIITIPN
jgi:broad specificity phosphatase PhoE